MVATKVSQTSSQQGNGFFQVKSLPGLTGDGQSNSNLMTWIAEDHEEKQKESRRRFDSFQLELLDLQDSDSASLDEMSDQMLKVCLTQFQMTIAVSNRNEAELTAFRDQLTAFDQTADQSRSISSGKTPEDAEQADMTGTPNAAEAAREALLQKGAELNDHIRKRLMDSDTYSGSLLDHVIGNVWRGGLDNGWAIDVNAADIRQEIDRVLSKLHSVTQSFSSGISKVTKELERRGYSLKDPYADYFAQKKSLDANSEDEETRRVFMLRELCDAIWPNFKQGAEDDPEIISL
jgi:hypothetical protein